MPTFHPVVVAGGVTEETPAYNSDVQILDLSTDLWRPASNSLPDVLDSGTVVQLENTFIVVGGQKGSDREYQDTLLQFEPDSETWVVREERMRLARSSSYAALVGEDKVECYDL